MEATKDDAAFGSIGLIEAALGGWPSRLVFTDEEIDTIKKLIRDRGFEYSLESDTEKVNALAVKLGMPVDSLGSPVR